MKVLALISVLFLSVNSQPFGNKFAQAPFFNGTNWAVLVAGSSTWDNYRHQADVYHAYQVVRSHGIPDKNIIVFHSDDIAFNPLNPTKGVVINRPNGPDVYHGVPKDYIGADVNPDNFLAVLRGDKELAKKGKKVLESGPDDHVFIYFADHGAPDIIAFPIDFLYGEDLNDALKYMYKNKMYSKLVFYLETCESGSMFDTLLSNNMNIYATTAANTTESSYGCYFDDKINAALGDYYSILWLEDSDKKSLTQETLRTQFEYVKKWTNQSHVMEYGDKTIANLPLSQFLGPKESSNKVNMPSPKNIVSVDSGDVPVYILKNKIRLEQNNKMKKIYNQQLEQLLTGRQYLVNHLQRFVKSIEHLVGNNVNSIMNVKQELIHRSCYRRLVDIFHRKCFNLNRNSFALRKLHLFVNVCEVLHQNNENSIIKTLIDKTVDSLDNYCQHYLKEYPKQIN